MSEHNEPLSIIRVDYTSLDSLLASSQWQKADEETAAVMLKIASRVTVGWLREEDIKDFPCQDLQTINDLWVKYSQGRFGFSVQSNVWESIGEDYGNVSSDKKGRSR
ncbi:MAG: GUN4 domain-containing protein [Gloeocapsa sp. UFS-A4-WI-NPMV-4B04]|nr:GUN4 domain-containing protein [Gloeocapsa sp. UFS-A4-WI-NPMV-4B04]